MIIEIPDRLVQEALECHILQQKGDTNPIELRNREVERRESHIAEIVCAIIAREFKNRKLITYNKIG